MTLPTSAIQLPLDNFSQRQAQTTSFHIRPVSNSTQLKFGAVFRANDDCITFNSRKTKMINKSFLVAAIAAACVSGPSLVSAADAFFASNQTQPAKRYLEIGPFNSMDIGIVEIFDFRLGVIGELLGERDTNAGANSGFQIRLSRRPTGNVLAVLTINGTVRGEQMIRLTDTD